MVCGALLDAGVEICVICHFWGICGSHTSIDLRSSLLCASTEGGEEMLEPGKDEGFQDPILLRKVERAM